MNEFQEWWGAAGERRRREWAQNAARELHGLRALLAQREAEIETLRGKVADALRCFDDDEGFPRAARIEDAVRDFIVRCVRVISDNPESPALTDKGEQ